MKIGNVQANPHQISDYRSLDFNFDIEPFGKQRARSGRHRHFTPTKTRVTESEIAEGVKNKLKELKIWETVTEAVRVDFIFVHAMPQSWSEKKKKAFDGMPCLKIPDWDNVCKLVCDSVSKGGFWKDDNQAYCGEYLKVWGRVGSTNFRLSW